MSISYREIRFLTGEDISRNDVLVSLLADIGFESFMDHESGFSAYIPDQEFNEMLFGEIIISANNPNFETIIHPPQNWNETWENQFEPVQVNDDLWIRAPFHEPVKQAKMEIVIEPKMSFGTGHHATTTLMCDAIYQMDLEGKNVLDFGCGTGILGILALKNGAASVVGIDIETWAVENALENAQRNDVRMDVLVGGIQTIQDQEGFDLILANINRNVLMKDAEEYLAKLNVDGTLLLSGILETDIRELIPFYETMNLKLIQEKTREGWGCLLMQKHL